MSKLIQISIEVWLEKITAPAADFSPHELACLEVEMLGKKMRTTEIPLNFPIVFDQRIIFKRMYKHATIMRAVEHLYHDPLGIRLLRRSVSDKEGQTVARYDGSTGNTLLNDTETNSDRAYGSARASQMVDLRICVEGFPLKQGAGGIHGVKAETVIEEGTMIVVRRKLEGNTQVRAMIMNLLPSEGSLRSRGRS
ncbi:hypothetical protein BV898_07779 [Hypsibius exemplaris]|uniref:Spermatogenesis-associated protein 6 N-terminal domain-containing protein n=1 Tax=Hypsibius exemplaris TaxID=2072580 RepID=A0A1W0WSK8_HYPEX|nr:hypothetical protein BV898_07779 [Hypsibius exemplaris]